MLAKTHFAATMAATIKEPPPEAGGTTAGPDEGTCAFLLDLLRWSLNADYAEASIGDAGPQARTAVIRSGSAPVKGPSPGDERRLVSRTVLDNGRYLEVASFREKAPFTAQERFLFSAFFATIAHCAQRDQRLKAEQRLTKRLKDALGQLSIGIVLLDEDGLPLFLNPAAEEFLSVGGDASARSGGGLYRRRITERIRHRAERDGDTVEAVGEDRSRLSIVAALDPDGARTLLLASPTVPLGCTDLLRRHFSLSRLEAELAMRIANGADLQDIAVELKISIHTARAYLKRVFAKTGANRQSALAILVVRTFGHLRQGAALQVPATVPAAARDLS